MKKPLRYNLVFIKEARLVREGTGRERNRVYAYQKFIEVMNEQEIIPPEIIENKILLIRGKKVMLDRDLAVLYGVETKALKQAVKRNPKRFPEDFMFEMTQDEFKKNYFLNSGGGMS